MCSKAALFSTIATFCFLIGCSQSEIKTYRIAKEDRASVVPSASAADPHGGPAAPADMPHIHGKVPPGWDERPPERMRAASFQINGSGGRMAQMAVIPMPGAADIQDRAINMWREELGLEALDDEKLKAAAQAINIGELKGQFYEIVGNAPRSGEDFKRSTLGAVAERDGILWFAKLTGEGTLVAEQKANFQAYLKSLEFHDESHGSRAVAAAPSGQTGRQPEPRTAEQPVSANTGKLPPDSNLPRWSPPANWKEKTPGPMLTAAYAVTSDSGQADVTISKLGGEGGGVVANVNRWRGQLGLPPANDAEIQKSLTMIEVDGKKNSYMVDLKGTNVRTGKAGRMLAVGVPRGGETWFYKLMGDELVVEKEKEAFVKFIASAY